MSGMIVSSVVNAFSSNAAADTQANAAKDAANTQAGANRYASDLQKQMFDKQIELQEPFRAQGVTAINRLGAGLAAGGEFGTPFSQTNFQADPGYAFRLKEGMNQMNAIAARRGGLISGNALKAGQAYGQEMGSQEYQNAFDRYYSERTNMLKPLQSLAGVGQTSAESLSSSAGRYGVNAGNLASATGAAYGNAALAGGNARASAYQGYGTAAGQALGGLNRLFGNGGGYDAYQTSGDNNYFGSNSNGYGSGEGYSGMNAELGLGGS